MNSDGLQLFILGAGCSVGYGYPTAAAMVPALNQFAEGLGTDAERIRGVVQRTVELMRHLKVETIDELAHRLHHGCADEESVAPLERNGRRFRRMEEAKLAVSALFHSFEPNAAASGLKSYHSFLHRMFPSEAGQHYQDLLARSTARVFSFNYDRLFEIAFLQHFKVDSNYAFYFEMGLNSGINPVYNHKVEFFDNRFSFLKLHGSVGMFAWDDPFGVCHGHSMPRADGSVEVTDTAFFLPNADKTISNKPRPPLIFFPHEKEYLLSGQQTGFPYRVYANEVWRRAAAMPRKRLRFG